MKPRDLAIRLNVSQGQIHRYLSNTDASRNATINVSRYVLETWAHEMRDAEIYLRDYFKGD